MKEQTDKLKNQGDTGHDGSHKLKAQQTKQDSNFFQSYGHSCYLDATPK